jgi:hypothetical protein
MSKELYFYGDEKEIDKILLFFKKESHFGKDGISFVDLHPELTDEYIEENKIERWR